MCALCDQPMGIEEEWVGDIEAAVSLRDVPPRGDVRAIHKSCGELAPEFVKDAVQKKNRRRPGLRLSPYPWSRRYAPFRAPIPNLNICSKCFDEYESALGEPDALQRISDLLLRLRREHPVEWDCCGWKNDAIADVVLGRTRAGYSESGSVIARCWLTQHWRYVKSLDRQITISLSSVREKASDAMVELEWLHEDGSYKVFARFISWLNDNRAGYANTQAATRRFRGDRPNLVVTEKVLIDLAHVYDTIRAWPMNRGLHRVNPKRHQSDADTKLQPSVVIQEFVARQFGISSRLLGQVRAESKKSNPRN
jgi:hypothetical protein